MAFWHVFKRKTYGVIPVKERTVKLIDKEPIEWYKVTRFDETHGYYFKSIESILEAYPQMTRKGIELVLAGKQKTHMTYIIVKETL